MKKEDIRWQQRFAHYKKALLQLNDAVKLTEQRSLSSLEEQGLIKAFEFTHELAWNVMKDYLEFQGNTAITGSRDATREAFKMGLLIDGEVWMEMIKSRNQTIHTYNEDTAQDINHRITTKYIEVFKAFDGKMDALKNHG